MIIHICDICRKNMYEWLTVDVSIGAERDYINVSHLIPYKRKWEICKNCFDRAADSCAKMEES